MSVGIYYELISLTIYQLYIAYVGRMFSRTPRQDNEQLCFSKLFYKKENKTVYTYKKPTHVSQIPTTFQNKMLLLGHLMNDKLISLMPLCCLDTVIVAGYTTMLTSYLYHMSSYSTRPVCAHSSGNYEHAGLLARCQPGN